MGIHWNDGGYSTDVELYLRVANRNLRIAKIGPDSFVLREECELPPGTEGTIVIKVDGDERKIHAFLQNGTVRGAERVQFI